MLDAPQIVAAPIQVVTAHIQTMYVLIGSGCSSEDSGCSPLNGSCSTSVGGCFSLKRSLSGSTRVAEGATVGRRMAVRYVTWGASGSSGARANQEGKEMLAKRAKAEGTEAALPLAEKNWAC